MSLVAVSAVAIICAVGFYIYYEFRERKEREFLLNKEKKRIEELSTIKFNEKNNADLLSKTDLFQITNRKSKLPETDSFQIIDQNLEGLDSDKLSALNKLESFEKTMSDDVGFLWRYAKAHKMKASILGVTKEEPAKKNTITKGLVYAEKALKLDPENSEVNKWYAVLVGMRSEYLSIKEKINGGQLFLKHILIALQINPDDFSLHHFLGRFRLEISKLSWVERTAASTLFAELPQASYDDAISNFLKAEKLNPVPWKENKLLLARSYIGAAKYKEAVQYLEEAEGIKCISAEDHQFDEEIRTLLVKYSNY